MVFLPRHYYLFKLCRELIVHVFTRRFNTRIPFRHLENFEKEEDRLGVRLIDHTDIPDTCEKMFRTSAIQPHLFHNLQNEPHKPRLRPHGRTGGDLYLEFSNLDQGYLGVRLIDHAEILFP